MELRVGTLCNVQAHFLRPHTPVGRCVLNETPASCGWLRATLRHSGKGGLHGPISRRFPSVAGVCVCGRGGGGGRSLPGLHRRAEVRQPEIRCLNLSFNPPIFRQALPFPGASRTWKVEGRVCAGAPNFPAETPGKPLRWLAKCGHQK